jgi:hypothetical protein
MRIPPWVKWSSFIFIHFVVMVLVILGVVIVSRPSETSGGQPNFAGVEQKQKRLVLFLDGTWNSTESNTNVWRMRSLCAAQGRGGKPQLVYYEIGVNGFLGGVFGQGLDQNIRRAYEWLVENYNPGDEIYIFGFSRGAYTARSLAGLIAMNGVLQAGSPIGVSELFDRYRRANEETIWKLQEMKDAGITEKFTEQENWLLKYSQPAKITVVGVWDTVGSIGWDTSSTRITRSPLTSTAKISLPRCGISDFQKTEKQSSRNGAHLQVWSSVGSSALMPMSEAAIPLTCLRKRLCAG